MMLDFVLCEEFFSSLTDVDAAIARRVAAAGCRLCGGPLHQANYDRKPRGGVPGAAGETFVLRHSLCCGRQGCRRRALPPSLRFLGRRVYLGVVVVVASVWSQLTSTVWDACDLTGVPSWTLRRWGAWWRGTFVESPIWAVLRARFRPPPPAEADLPRSLVVRIGDELSSHGPPGLCEMCRFVAELMAELTTSSVPDGSRFVREVLAMGAVV